MSKMRINGCEYYYEEAGEGPETIVLSHGLLWSGKMFHKQVEHFKDRYRVITYDHRGQGRSEVTQGGYDMEQLYEDAAELVERLAGGPVHFGGLSMGGFVAMRLAARRPELVKSLVLMETSAQAEPNQFKYSMLNGIVKVFGVKSVTGPVMKIMFGKKFLTDPARREEREYWKKELQSNRKTIVRAVEGVIHRRGVEDELGRITCPTLILVGTQDVATVPEKAEFMHRHIPNSRLVYVEGAGHTACVEEAERYNEVLEGFWGF